MSCSVIELEGVGNVVDVVNEEFFFGVGCCKNLGFEGVELNSFDCIGVFYGLRE